MRKEKIMIVASSDFVYTSRSLFWPDVIILAAVDLDLKQSVSMAIGDSATDKNAPNHDQRRGQLRFCCDFRYLYAVTIKDAYPKPRRDESLSKLGDAKFLTTLDLGSAFWQVPLRKKDREKTGFACELRLYQWKMMLFGLWNATATFR